MAIKWACGEMHVFQQALPGLAEIGQTLRGGFAVDGQPSRLSAAEIASARTTTLYMPQYAVFARSEAVFGSQRSSAPRGRCCRACSPPLRVPAAAAQHAAMAPARSVKGKHIAVVGSGVSGLASAWLLQHHGAEVTLFEAQDACGGHTLTDHTSGFPVDLGFQVYNLSTYPHLVSWFEHLGVATEPSNMSFSLSLDGGSLEWASHGLGAVFAQRRNLLSLRFWGMLWDVLRFGRRAPDVLAPHNAAAFRDVSLGAYLARNGCAHLRAVARGFVTRNPLPNPQCSPPSPQPNVRTHVATCTPHSTRKLAMCAAPRVLVSSPAVCMESTCKCAVGTARRSSITTSCP